MNSNKELEAEAEVEALKEQNKGLQIQLNEATNASADDSIGASYTIPIDIASGTPITVTAIEKKKKASNLEKGTRVMKVSSGGIYNRVPTILFSSVLEFSLTISPTILCRNCEEHLFLEP